MFINIFYIPIYFDISISNLGKTIEMSYGHISYCRWLLCGQRSNDWFMSNVDYQWMLWGKY
jgi:hypothetical protein